MSRGRNRSRALYNRRLAEARKSNYDAYNKRQETNKDNVGMRANDFDIYDSNGVFDETGEKMTSGSYSAKPQYQRLRYGHGFDKVKSTMGKLTGAGLAIFTAGQSFEFLRKNTAVKGSDGYVETGGTVDEDKLKAAAKENIAAEETANSKKKRKLSFSSKLSKHNKAIKQSVLTSDEEDEDTVGGGIENI